MLFECAWHLGCEFHLRCVGLMGWFGLGMLLGFRGIKGKSSLVLFQVADQKNVNLIPVERGVCLGEVLLCLKFRIKPISIGF